MTSWNFVAKYWILAHSDFSKRKVELDLLEQHLTCKGRMELLHECEQKIEPKGISTPNWQQNTSGRTCHYFWQFSIHFSFFLTPSGSRLRYRTSFSASLKIGEISLRRNAAAKLTFRRQWSDSSKPIINRSSVMESVCLWQFQFANRK